MVNTHGHIGHRICPGSGKIDRRRQLTTDGNILLSQGLGNPGYIHVFRRCLDIQGAVSGHLPLGGEDTVTDGDIKLADRKSPVHIGEINIPLSKDCASQMAAVNVSFKINAGVIYGSGNTYAPVHSAIYTVRRLLQECHNVLNVPAVEIKISIQSSSGKVVASLPLEGPLFLPERTFIDANHVIFIMDARRHIADRIASDGNGPGGRSAVKGRIVEGTAHFAVQGYDAFHIFPRQHPFNADICHGHCKVEALRFTGRSVYHDGAIVNIAQPILQGQTMVLIGIPSGKTLEELSHDGAAPGGEITGNIRIVQGSRHCEIIRNPAGHRVIQFRQGKEAFDSRLFCLNRQIHIMGRRNTDGALHCMGAGSAHPAETGNIQFPIVAAKTAVDGIESGISDMPISGAKRSFAFRVMQGTCHMAAERGGACHILTGDAGKEGQVHIRSGNRQIHTLGIIDALHKEGAIPHKAAGIGNRYGLSMFFQRERPVIQ